VLILAESLSCLPRLRVYEALSLPARSTRVSFPWRVSFSNPSLCRLVTTALRTAWLLLEVAFASVLSVLRRAFPCCTENLACLPTNPSLHHCVLLLSRRDT
jgi:hypothetical protein